MKYVVVLDFTSAECPPPLDETDWRTATCYDSMSGAQNSIDSLASIGLITSIEQTSVQSNDDEYENERKYKIGVIGWYDGVVSIIPLPNSMVFYRVTVNDIDAKQETARRYRDLSHALDYADEVIGATGKDGPRLPFGQIISDDYLVWVDIRLDIIGKQDDLRDGDEEVLASFVCKSPVGVLLLTLKFLESLKRGDSEETLRLERERQKTWRRIRRRNMNDSHSPD